MSLLELPEELISSLFTLLQVDDWTNLSLVSNQFYRIGNGEDIWKYHCTQKSIFKKTHGNKTWKEQYVESCRFITLEFEKTMFGFHHVNTKKIKVKVMRKLPFYEISEGLSRYFGACGHSISLECDETCHGFARYLMSRKGAIIDRSRSPFDVGLCNNDKISIILDCFDKTIDGICLLLAIKKLYLEKEHFRLYCKEDYSPHYSHLSSSLKSIIINRALTITKNHSFEQVNLFSIEIVIRSLKHLDSVTTLYWNTDFMSLEGYIYTIPNTVTNLSLLSRQESIPYGFIPSSVTKLTLVAVYPVANLIPNSVINLNVTYFKSKSDAFPPDVIPGSVVTLVYHSDIELLPNSLPRDSIKTMTLGGLFNRPLSTGSLPDSITDLTFNGRFSMSIERESLPKSLVHLRIPQFYNYTIEDFNNPYSDSIFPKTLLSLRFGDSFNRAVTPLSTLINLESLHLGKGYSHPITVLPATLTSLHLPEKLNPTAEELKRLLPASLTSLTLSGFNQPLLETSDVFPQSLEILDLTVAFNQPIPVGALPRRLRVLNLSAQFNHPLEVGCLPDHLEELKFRDNFNKTIPLGLLPKSLRKLEFGNSYNQRIVPLSLPTNLARLVLGRDFNQPLEIDSLSSTSLHTIHFGMNFEQIITSSLLPPTLQYIEFQLTIEQRGEKKNKIFDVFSTKKTKSEKKLQLNEPQSNNNINNNNNKNIFVNLPNITMKCDLHLSSLPQVLNTNQRRISPYYLDLLEQNIGFDMSLMGTENIYHVRSYSRKYALLLDRHLECGFIKKSSLEYFSIGQTIGVKRKLLFI
ncbi:FNIP repeat-containing protein [Heterostelium album PN500]|uniref:FNIP repeat-containing protein n=1 Tax=Heterostelium pallidum (strain ATCC 26659 / Pp 5 / PN500) TaxID=670386 RepID=D3B484_HETP5|nr:FNIP repeat-containing protein [Heterostelium album PN500]EFA84132.1 FNIP repeat-containing protein [Heterostelium album PN500]|eukprot:XP_020436249.1 FNIP repeat-containing protein [Heterostelium album PN500]